MRIIYTTEGIIQTMYTFIRTFHVLVILFIFLVGGCARHGKVIFEDETDSVLVEVYRGASPVYYESTLPDIPPDHMPPPGRCRIWIPGQPLNQQPTPGDCKVLRRHVPPGAWLIRG